MSEQQAHWHIAHALSYIGASCDEETRKRRIKECINLLVSATQSVCAVHAWHPVKKSVSLDLEDYQ